MGGEEGEIWISNLHFMVSADKTWTLEHATSVEYARRMQNNISHKEIANIILADAPPFDMFYVQLKIFHHLRRLTAKKT
jgi:hypothetical protein